jgi:hypothetical protein
VLGGVGGAALVAAAAVLVVGHGSTPTTTTPRAQPKYTPPAVAAPAEPTPKPHRLVRLTIAAAGSSWLEVRRGSSTGAVLFSGVLDGGRTIRFRGPRLWARFGAAGNLRITQDGRPVPLQGTYDKVFRPR